MTTAARIISNVNISQPPQLMLLFRETQLFVSVKVATILLLHQEGSEIILINGATV